MIRALALLVVVGCAGTTHRVAATGTRSALQEFQSAVEASDLSATQQLGTAAMNGALASLADPAQQARLEDLVASVTEAAANTLALRLHREASGLELASAHVAQRAIDIVTAEVAASLRDGELHTALHGLTRDITRSTVVDTCRALGAMFPECAELDCARCIEAKISTIARSAARGMTAEVAGVMRVPILLSVFVAGIAAALLVGRVRRGRSTLPA